MCIHFWFTTYTPYSPYQKRAFQFSSINKTLAHKWHAFNCKYELRAISASWYISLISFFSDVTHGSVAQPVHCSRTHFKSSVNKNIDYLSNQFQQGLSKTPGSRTQRMWEFWVCPWLHISFVSQGLDFSYVKSCQGHWTGNGFCVE